MDAFVMAFAVYTASRCTERLAGVVTRVADGRGYGGELRRGTPGTVGGTGADTHQPEPDQSGGTGGTALSDSSAGGRHHGIFGPLQACPFTQRAADGEGVGLPHASTAATLCGGWRRAEAVGMAHFGRPVETWPSPPDGNR